MPRAWPENDTSGRKRTTRELVDARIAAVARRQRHLVRLDQLISLGLSPRAVQHRADRNSLHRIHRGVYATHGPPYSPQQMWLAATLACGPDAALSDWCAAVHLGIREALPSAVEVTSPTGAGRRFAGITVHRRPLDPRDVWRKQGIPTTTAARTILDLAARAGPEGTEALIMAADSRRLLDRHRLEELAEWRRGLPGVRHILALVTDGPAELRSANEARLLSICREFGVPRPLTNHRIDVAGRTFFADFCWPGMQLIVEADSWRWHGGRLASESDRDRDQLLSVAGWRVVHFTRDQILHRRGDTGVRLSALTRR